MKRNFIAIILTLVSVSLFATNGMNMIGYGPRSSAMGGVIFGFTDNVNSINTNPGAIGFFEHKQFELNLGLLLPNVTFKNEFNDCEGEKEIFPLPGFSYVHGNSSKFVFGLGVYSQGGMGATFKNRSHNLFRNYDMNPMGEEDPLTEDMEYHSKIGYVKIMPAITYRLNRNFSFGIAPSLGYSMLEMKMPYSIDPMEMKGIINSETGMTFGNMFGASIEQGGLGYEEVTAYADLDDAATAYGFGATFGGSFSLNDNLTFGFGYTIKSTLTFEGKASMDMTSQFYQAYEKMVGGAMSQYELSLQDAQNSVNTQLAAMGIDMTLGMISDYNVEIEMSWPQQFGFGFGYKASDKLLLAADLKWINWKDAMKEFKMSFDEGTNANINAMMGSESLKLNMPLKWEDQIVLALGIEYSLTPKLSLRSGYNFSSNPVPEKTLLPIFPAVIENHITFGFGYFLTKNLNCDIAYELNLEKKIEVNNSIVANEYDNSSSSLSENVLHFGINLMF